MATVRTWIISVHNSEGCGAKLFRKFGDVNDIKNQLVKMVTEAEDDYGYELLKNESTISIDDFEEDIEDCLTAVAQFMDFHVDFTAIPLDYINDIATED